MYSWKTFFAFGVQRAILSLTTIALVALYFLKYLESTTMLAYILFILINSYVNFFTYLKENNLPTSKVYNTGIPSFVSNLLSLYIFIVLFYKIFIN